MSGDVSSRSKIGRIYLDSNATTRPFPEVVETIAHHLQHSYANPGSRHVEGQFARKALDDAREKTAELLGAEPDELIYTSGGTEATNLALFGASRRTPGTIVLSAGEHPATVESCRELERRGWTLLFLEVDEGGLIREELLPDLPWREIQIVSLILAHNETGVIQNFDTIARLCREHEVFFHIDAVQTVGKIDVNFALLDASALSFGAHKFHGPRGIGGLLLRRGIKLAPTTFGGHQEAGRRPGTEITALACGMHRALDLCLKSVNERHARLATMRDSLQAGIIDAFQTASINGSIEHRLPNTLNIAFPGVDGEAMLIALDLAGIACSLGSTCASGSAEPAPVLLAMNRPEEVYKSSIRFSLSSDNTSAEVEEAITRICSVAQRLHEASVTNEV